MTDKEIIIDGVDVSGCENSFKQFDNWIGKDVVMCDCTLGCRCEPKENHCKFYMYYLEQQLKRKEQECEELKKELEAVYDDCKGCPTCNEALYNANLYAKEYRKLKQTLTEIKDYCNKYPQNSIGFKKYILQKISECEEEK